MNDVGRLNNYGIPKPCETDDASSQFMPYLFIHGVGPWPANGHMELAIIHYAIYRQAKGQGYSHRIIDIDFARAALAILGQDFDRNGGSEKHAGDEGTISILIYARR